MTNADDGGSVGDLRSSADPADIKTAGERREGACPPAQQSGEGPDDGRGDELWTNTSPKVRKLQRVPHRKAKAEPRWRFCSLQGELYRRDIPSDRIGSGDRERRRARSGWARGGGAGKRSVVARSLAARTGGGIANEDLPPGSGPARVWKDQARAKRRALGIPAVKDRVVQGAAAIMWKPLREEDFRGHSCACRPKRRTHQAMDTAREALLSGKAEAVDADLSSYSGLIPHRELLRLVAKRVGDGLIKAWLRAPIAEEGRGTGRRKAGSYRLPWRTSALTTWITR